MNPNSNWMWSLNQLLRGFWHLTVAISELTILKISNAIDFHSLLGLFVMITSGMVQFMNFAISFSSKDKLQNLGWTKSGRTFNVHLTFPIYRCDALMCRIPKSKFGNLKKLRNHIGLNSGVLIPIHRYQNYRASK